MRENARNECNQFTFTFDRLAWLREIGLLGREYHRWVPKKPGCESGRDFVPVGLTEVKPAIKILLVGYAVCVAMFVIENFKVRILRRYLNVH